MLFSGLFKELGKTISVNLPQEIEARLKALADKSRQSMDDELRQIIDLGLEDLEDCWAGPEVVGRIARGEEKVLSSEEFWGGMDRREDRQTG